MRRPPRPTRLGLLLLLLLLGGAVPAAALPSRAELAAVGVHPPPGARIPEDLSFRDQTGRTVRLGDAMAGRPGLLLFEDYRCRTLCGPALSIVSDALARRGLRPGRDFRLTAVGLNPREGPADATRFAAARLAGHPALLAASRFLTGSAPAVRAAAQALGYAYAYDADADQYVHPAAVFAASPDGRVVEVLEPTALRPGELEAALGRAARDRPGPLSDPLQLLCHGLAPLQGVFDGAAMAGVRGLALLLILGGGLALARLARRGRPS